MTASAKRKKEKKKDFQKAKLKVGKNGKKPDSATDTSFSARRLVLGQQNLSVAAPAVSALFSHHVSMLRSKTDTARQESLAHLATVMKAWPSEQPLPEPSSSLLPKLQPLMLDSSKGVRMQLLKLLQCFPPQDLQIHAPQLLLYTRAAMTHLSSEIKLYAMDVLEWLLGVCGRELVSCAGGWSKTLETFIGLLRWDKPGASSQGWTAGFQQSTKLGESSKMQARHLSVLALFIAQGMPSSSDRPDAVARGNAFPLWHYKSHALACRSDPFARLALFGIVGSDASEYRALEDREDRQRLFVQQLERSMLNGLETTRKEGGDVGRASSRLLLAISKGLEDFDRDTAEEGCLVKSLNLGIAS